MKHSLEVGMRPYMDGAYAPTESKCALLPVSKSL